MTEPKDITDEDLIAEARSGLFGYAIVPELAARLEAALERERGHEYDGGERANRILGLEAERDALRAAILQNCKEGCKGRESYLGKLRHEPNCLAWDLDLVREPEKRIDK